MEPHGPDLRGSLRRLSILIVSFRAGASLLLTLLPPEALLSWPLFGLSTHPGRTALASALIIEGLRGLRPSPLGAPSELDSSATLTGDPPEEPAGAV